MRFQCPIHLIASVGIPRYRDRSGPAFLSAGFRPFFLLAAIWSALAVPLWLALLGNHVTLPISMPLSIWHAHEMIFGFGAAAVAGFLLTAIPNWTGRMPLQNVPLIGLVGLWLLGRVALLVSEVLGPSLSAAVDLAFPLVFLIVIAREIIAGRNFRNLPMLGALGLLLVGNLFVHLEGLDIVATAATGNRLGIATLLMLISLVGGRIIPSFTGNWLARERRDATPPAPFDRFDAAVLATTGFALALWVADPALSIVPWLALASGAGALARLARWRGHLTLRDPLLWILHLGYAWVGIGLLLLGGAVPVLPEASALHALTAGAIGTMTIAVMTRASLGHTGRPLVAGPMTTTMYALVTLATLLRIVAPRWVDFYVWVVVLTLSAVAWVGAFGAFALVYGAILIRKGVRSA